MSNKAMVRIALVTSSFLLVPLVAMQLTDEVDWEFGDFVVAGALLAGAGLAYEFLAQRRNNPAYRAAIAVAVIGALVLVWTSLAVGFP